MLYFNVRFASFATFAMDPVTFNSPSRYPEGHGVTVQPNKSQVPLQHDSNESFVGEIIRFAILALVFVIPFRFFVAQPFIVSGASMHPTFETGQYLIVDQISYRFEEPQRGEVIIFKYPSDPSKYFIKRIVALPGETIELANGITTITNPTTGESHVLDEPYLKTDPTDDRITITLLSDEYFVMGDNRAASSDSRVWGPVPRKNIVGRAFIRLLPPDTFSLFPGVYIEQYVTANKGENTLQ